MSDVRTPTWVKHAIFYQIFPDRFCRSGKVSQPAGLEPWDTAPTEKGYKGGDLYGLIERLDHVQELGATALYLCPVFSSSTNHRYNTHDYFCVDPMLGGNDALHQLINEVHRRDMHIVLDGVFNHVSRSFLPFADVLENHDTSPYRDWFRIGKFPPNAYDTSRPPDYAAWWNLHHMPVLNHDNDEVREYIYQVAEYWLTQGIDGWRLDVPFEIQSPGFWQQFRNRVKAINPEAYIVGEVWDAAQHWLHGDCFDAVMNYFLGDRITAFAAGVRVVADVADNRSPVIRTPLDGTGYAGAVQEVLDLYAWDIQCAQMNLLGSHDTARVGTLMADDEASVRLANLLVFTFPGAPTIYYGDEIGMTGGRPDRECRGAFPWDQPETWNRERFAVYQQLIAMRKAHPALRTGRYEQVYADTNAYVFSRTSDEEYLLVAVNTATDQVAITAPIATCSRAELVWGTAEVAVTDRGIALEVPGRAGVIARLHR